MKKMFGLDVSEDTFAFLTDIQDTLKGQFPLELKCGNYGFLVEPSGVSLSIWHNNEEIACYESLESFICQFKINGIPLSDLIEELEYL